MAHQHGELVGAAFLELVGAGAGEFLQLGRDAFLGHDRGHAARQRQLGQQRRIGVLELELDTQGALGRECRDFLPHGLAARREFHPALQRSHDVIGIQVAAVVELDALADRDGVGQAVLGDHRHALRQHRCHVPVGIEGVERFVDVLHDRADEIRGADHRVQALRLADHRQVRGAALGRFGECGDRQQAECDSGCERAATVRHRDLRTGFS